MVKKHLRQIYIILILILLYAPILTLIVLSFNASKSRSRWGGFTLKWYVELVQNQQIMSALYTTLVLALASSILATIIGTMASISISSMKRRTKSIVMGITNIPMLNAEIVTAVSLMLLFMRFMNLGFNTVLLSHITFNIPYVILSVMPKLRQTNKTTYEAALDLGATPLSAFFKVVLPDIFPGILSGFLLSFTLSLDDFVITHFTKGPGIDTLSTKIYTEVRKGIKPEMYALSTLLFLSVLLLFYAINRKPQKRQPSAGSIKRTAIAATAMLLAVVLGTASLGANLAARSEKTITVYNWGEYMDPDVITMFEKETGINVIYEEFETNEIMYPKVKTGAIQYDVVCPSDYMIQRMAQEDLLAEIDFNNVPNIKYIGSTYMETSTQFDPDNKYSVPYTWGTVGILYNKTLVDDPVTSWNILWNEKYANNILMQDSVRDAFAIALILQGKSVNSTDKKALLAARDLLIKQKPLVQAYVIDQVRDQMIGGEAALGVIYSGEAIFTQRENPDLEYVIPDEGSNIFLDSWVIPKNAKNKKGAEVFLNFLCRPDIAKMNFDYITYSTPNEGAKELLDEDIRNNTIAFPDEHELKRCETYSYLGDDLDAYYNNLWKEVKSK